MRMGWVATLAATGILSVVVATLLTDTDAPGECEAAPAIRLVTTCDVTVDHDGVTYSLYSLRRSIPREDLGDPLPASTFRCPNPGEHVPCTEHGGLPRVPTEVRAVDGFGADEVLVWVGTSELVLVPRVDDRLVMSRQLQRFLSDYSRDRIRDAGLVRPKEAG